MSTFTSKTSKTPKASNTFIPNTTKFSISCIETMKHHMNLDFKV